MAGALMPTAAAVWTLERLAERLGARLRYRAGGKAASPAIVGLATLEEAVGDQLSFVIKPRYLAAARVSGAAALIVGSDLAQAPELQCHSLLVVEDAYLAYANAAALFERSQRPKPGVHGHAWVAPEATLGAGVSVGPGAVVMGDACLGADVVLGAGCVVEAGVRLGPGTRLVANVFVGYGSRIGADCVLHPGAVIGSEGFGQASSTEGWKRIAQLGGVRIGDRVEIGANTTVDRGALSDTVIESGVRIDNQVHVAHNVRIGENTAIAGCVGIAGSAVIGKNCKIGGAVGIVGHIRICDNVDVTAMSIVSRSIAQPGKYSNTLDIRPKYGWQRSLVHLRHLDELHRRVRRLERQLASYEQRHD